MFSIGYTMKDARRDRLNRLFRGPRFNGERAKFMKAAALSKGRISQLFDPSEAFGEVAARRLAMQLGLRPDYFESDAVTAQEPEPNSRMKPAQMRNLRVVCVVGQGQGGWPERLWSDGDHPVGATDEYAEVSTTDEYAFACRVVGDSMIPRYMPGEFALVEPGVNPEIEDDVLVRLATGETMLKRLLSRRSGIRLGSYNSAEVLSLDEAEVTWMYYVAHPIPARRIRQRVERDQLEVQKPMPMPAANPETFDALQARAKRVDSEAHPPPRRKAK